jgi:predicted ATPase
LVATKGWGAVEVERAYTRARELCAQGEETPQFFPVLRGLCGLYSVRPELQTARELAEQLMALAQGVPDQAFLLEAHWIRGATLFFLGDLPAAQADLEQGTALYDITQHSSHSLLYGQDPGVSCRVFAAAAAWFFGFADQALKRSEAALSLTKEISHPFTLVVALIWAAIVHQLRREAQAVQEKAEAALMLSSKEGFAFFLALGTLLRGWALAEQGQDKEGIAQIHQGLTALRTTRQEVLRPYALALLAQAQGKAGLITEGLSTLADALTTADTNGERLSEAELYRLKGTLTLQSRASIGQVSGKSQTSLEQVTTSLEAEAEACFHKAIEIARRQQAKSLELRAATNLARLWQQHGKQRGAHQLLSEIYGWFTEGFDTKDLQEAKALLEKLA